MKTLIVVIMLTLSALVFSRSPAVAKDGTWEALNRATRAQQEQQRLLGDRFRAMEADEDAWLRPAGQGSGVGTQSPKALLPMRRK